MIRWIRPLPDNRLEKTFRIPFFIKTLPLVSSFAVHAWLFCCTEVDAYSAVRPSLINHNFSLPVAEVLKATSDDEVRSTLARQLHRGLSEIPSTVVSVRSFGAIGDGINDDADAIERATANVPRGEILLFPPGTYLQNRSVKVTAADVILFGSGAELRGSNPYDHAIMVDGDRSSIVGFRLTAVQNERRSGTSQFRIVLRGEGNEVVANEIDGGAAGGIKMVGARHFRIDSNTVRNTLADGIHVTDGSVFGVITANTVRATGDDLISVVSYRDQRLASDILIAKNDVAANPWGRGIAVVGGRDVTIADNRIREVAAGAGVYIAREANVKTYGTFNIVAKNNVLEHIQTRGDVLGGRPRNGQGAFEVFATSEGDPELTVHGVLIQGNVVRDAVADGVRIMGDVCNIEVHDNHFESLGGRRIRAISEPWPTECASFERHITGASVGYH